MRVGGVRASSEGCWVSGGRRGGWGVGGGVSVKGGPWQFPAAAEVGVALVDAGKSPRFVAWVAMGGGELVREEEGRVAGGRGLG